MAGFDDFYAELGRKIRTARERPGQKTSQEKLAKRLGISRASIVNIEAGRQHAPLHVLWQIAEELGTDLALLIPRREDLLLANAPVPLDQETIAQIETAAHGDAETVKAVTTLVSKLKASIEKQHQSRTSSAKTRLRN
jgi:transcriptional regulator with XRE-family HTH domain